ncbi:MAG: T9SS type A sorting domain-containing protein, partial [Candidatus Glassbacteria bacterium]
PSSSFVPTLSFLIHLISAAYGLVMTDFPLFFLESGSAGALAGAVMDMFEEVAGISDDEVTRVPLAYALSQNYPNPFNPTTTISFDIPEVNGTKQHVSLTIYNLRGRHVRTLINSELEHGNHMVVWDGRNDSGEAVSSGIYFYRLKNPRWNSTRKMIMKR